MNARQEYGMRRIRHGNPISPDLARQLIKKGLVTKDRVYQRKEWNRVVATLWYCKEVMEDKNFIEIWMSAASLTEVANKTNLPLRHLIEKAKFYRNVGINIKKLLGEEE